MSGGRPALGGYVTFLTPIASQQVPVGAGGTETGGELGQEVHFGSRKIEVLGPSPAPRGTPQDICRPGNVEIRG